MFYYKKSALACTSSKCSSHKNFRCSAKCPQLHRREYVKSSTAIIMCQQLSMNLLLLISRQFTWETSNVTLMLHSRLCVLRRRRPEIIFFSLVRHCTDIQLTAAHGHEIYGRFYSQNPLIKTCQTVKSVTVCRPIYRINTTYTAKLSRIKWKSWMYNNYALFNNSVRSACKKTNGQ